MFFIWVILIGLLQATVLNGLNLLILFAVFAGLRKGPFGGLLIGCAIGTFSGILSASSFTFNLILYSMAGFASGLVSASLYYVER